MLKNILSVSGKSGLFKMISQGKNVFIAESLVDQRRIPVYSRNTIVSLGDIGIYTDGEAVPLSQIFSIIKEKENGKPIDFSRINNPDKLKSYFMEILPNFDRNRVYLSDIKKITSWYNLLINNGIVDFEKKEETEEPLKGNS
ncbi:MAG: DUF5606 domain-containing protein [Dysgonamonadaceae bacterium]|nr:DUF5606 domain-containing protein [Dysgonamonadaceae bacterium]